jgi:hypothetical protein
MGRNESVFFRFITEFRTKAASVAFNYAKQTQFSPVSAQKRWLPKKQTQFKPNFTAVSY